MMKVYQFSDGKETRWIAALNQVTAKRVANCLGWRSTSKLPIFEGHRVAELIANHAVDITIYKEEL